MVDPSDDALIKKLSKNGLAQFNKDGAAEAGSLGNFNETSGQRTYALLRAGVYSKIK